MSNKQNYKLGQLESLNQSIDELLSMVDESDPWSPSKIKPNLALQCDSFGASLNLKPNGVDDFSHTFGPIGLPHLYGTDDKDLLTWLESSGAWGGKAQLKTLLQEGRSERKLSAKLEKSITKLFAARHHPIDAERTLHLTKRINAIVLNPFDRSRSWGKQADSLSKYWSYGPVAALLRTSQLWTDCKESERLQDFIVDYDEELFWPELFIEDKGHLPKELKGALGGFLNATLEIAQRWCDLNEKQRNGVLLGAWAGASFFQSSHVFIPFAAIHTELRSRLRMDGDILGASLCSQDGTGRMSSLVHQVLIINSGLSTHLGIQIKSGEDNYQLAQTALAGLIAFVAQSDDAQSIVGTHANAIIDSKGVVLNNFTEDMEEFICGLGLESECEASVLKLREEFEHLFSQFNEHKGESQLELEIVTLYQRSIIDLIEKVESKEPLSTYMEQQQRTSDTVSQPLNELKKKLLGAANAMDTDQIIQITIEIESAKEEFLVAFDGYLEDLFIEQTVLRQVEEITEQDNNRILHLIDAYTADQPLTQAEGAQRKLKDELSTKNAECQLLETHLADMKVELHKEKNRTMALEQSQVAEREQMLSEKSPIYRSLKDDAKLVDVLEALPDLFPNRVYVLPSALESARKSTYKNVRKVANNLLSLCGPYYDALASGESDATARKLIGTAYRPQESESTLANVRMRKLREFDVDGESVLFTQHLTLGIRRNEQSCIQVYFRIIGHKIIIAYIGKHLPVSSQ